MKLIISLIKNKNVTYINFLYNKYSDMLVNLGAYIIKNNFAYLPIERNDLFNTAFEVCNNLWKINEKTIEKHGVKKVLQMQMVQKVILIQRKFSTQSNKILNNYINILDNDINQYSYEEFNTNQHDLELILNRNQDKIDKFNELTQLIFNEYFILDNSRKTIAQKYNIPIKVVNLKVDYLKRFMNKNFVK